MNLRFLAIASLAAVLLTPLHSSAQLIQDTATRSLSPDQISQLNACVEQTYNEMVSDSETRCTMPQPAYAAAGNTDSHTLNLRWKVGSAPFASYVFVPGSAAVTHNQGQCVHDVNPAIENPTTFLCQLFTKGCGFLKEGGHVWGACAVSVKYVPQNGDLASIKEYCFAKVTGAAISKPTSYKKGCVLP